MCDRADKANVATSELAARCSEAAALARRALPADERFCFELFRRALAQRDQAAWAALVAQYEHLVQHWVGPGCSEVDDLTNEVFFRFWQRFTGAQFEAHFATLASVLAYLRVCAKSVAINHARRAALDALLQPLDDELTGHFGNEQAILAQMAHEELLARLYACCQDDPERAVVAAAFVQGMTPQEACRARPDLFASPAAVSRTKEKLLDRCRRRLAPDERLRS